MSDSEPANAPSFLDCPNGRRIAYARLSPEKSEGPGIVFLGGLRSDMTGSKAMALEQWARDNGRGFLRFDYSGHGASSGDFTEGCIGDWAEDAFNAFMELTAGPQILIGSSMGGWISLLLIKRVYAEKKLRRIAGFVGVAAAPDFTEDLMWARMPETRRNDLLANGRIEEPSDYGEDAMVITKKLIEDGRDNLVLRDAIAINAPVRLLHGSADPDVPLSTGLRLLHHIDCKDARLTVVKGAGHRMSAPSELELLIETVEETIGLGGASA